MSGTPPLQKERKKKCTSPSRKEKGTPSKKEKHLSQQLVQLRLSHENTNVVKSSSQIVLINCPILNNSNQQYQRKILAFHICRIFHSQLVWVMVDLVDVHQLEAVLVHLQLLL